LYGYLAYAHSGTYIMLSIRYINFASTAAIRVRVISWLLHAATLGGMVA